jgi:hypothetical protein
MSLNILNLRLNKMETNPELGQENSSQPPPPPPHQPNIFQIFMMARIGQYFQYF